MEHVGERLSTGRACDGSSNVDLSIAHHICLVLVAVGLLWPVIAKLGLGRLPGDIVIERDNFRLYLAIGTSVLISAVLSLILWLISR